MRASALLRLLLLYVVAVGVFATSCCHAQKDSSGYGSSEFRSSDSSDSDEDYYGLYGFCAWSGDAPQCGNGHCPDDEWYALGNSSIDQDGRMCAAGVNNLYCCPKKRTPGFISARFCTGKNLQGDCETVREESECVSLPNSMKDKVNSVFIRRTRNRCIRLYSHSTCDGQSVALHNGNSAKHTDLSKLNFGNKAISVGPCFRNDFCAPYSYIDNACQFPAEELYIGIGYRPSGTVNTIVNGDPAIFYMRGHKNRIEYVDADIESKHLDTGTQPTSESLEHVRSLGLDTDVVGMFLPARLGGKGTDPWNNFPLTPDPNIHVGLDSFHDIFYELVKKHELVSFQVFVFYLTPTDTRPTQIVFRVVDNRFELLFQDSLPNPVFRILGTTPVSPKLKTTTFTPRLTPTDATEVPLVTPDTSSDTVPSSSSYPRGSKPISPLLLFVLALFFLFTRLHE